MKKKAFRMRDQNKQEKKKKGIKKKHIIQGAKKKKIKEAIISSQR